MSTIFSQKLIEKKFDNSHFYTIFIFFNLKIFIKLIEKGTIEVVVKICTKQSVKKRPMLNLSKMLGNLLT